MEKESTKEIYELEIDKVRRENSDLYAEIVEGRINHSKNVDSVSEQLEKIIKTIEDEARFREEGVKSRKELNDLTLDQAQKIDKLKKELKNSNQEREELKKDLALLLEDNDVLVSENELKDQQIELLKKQLTESKKQIENLNKQNQIQVKELAELVDEKLNLEERNTQLQEKLDNSCKIIEESQKESFLLIMID